MVRDHVHEYRATIDWSGGAAGPVRDYRSYSREYRVAMDGKPDFRASADPHFRGDPALYNPEDMLLISLSACHMLSYLALCARANVEVRGYRDEAEGTMRMLDGALRFADVLLRPRVTVAPGTDHDKAKALHGDAHHLCFIANSVNFPVRNDPEIVEG
ncbi:OsmC family protein [Oceanibacterium hippocampi]|uniref:OsmC-like protein n=1 Tax=Oceanibacterium hippocampi TaxID=745714 RepID=A0A1Y5S4E6_9PROT|nr:OsmC family protein [Oceanibacterium hippocampi]SLN32423.1 OsmC-like protein [Oceanibacterium hippocampi]